MSDETRALTSWLVDGMRWEVPEDRQRCIEAALAGHPLAQYLLGGAFRSGDEVARDQLQARHWLEKAAEQHVTQAQVMLARLLETEFDEPEAAAAWYQRAAPEGDAQVQNYLGTLYWLGRGVPRDPLKAIDWWSQAANAGYGEALLQPRADSVAWHPRRATESNRGAPVTVARSR